MSDTPITDKMIKERQHKGMLLEHSILLCRQLERELNLSLDLNVELLDLLKSFFQEQNEN